MLKRLGRLRIVQAAIGTALAWMLKFVWWTSRYIAVPADPYAQVQAHLPFIITFWHGQHFMVPFARRKGHDIRVLISKHTDGEINAIAAEKLGLGTIRGSGNITGKKKDKGGSAGFRNLLKALEEGATVSMTADVPKRGRVAGNGIVTLAKLSGRPILPVCFTTMPRIDLNSWDKASVNLPFGRAVFVTGDLIFVGADADDAELEARRLEVEAALNTVTEKARAIADGREAAA